MHWGYQPVFIPFYHKPTGGGTDILSACKSRGLVVDLDIYEMERRFSIARNLRLELLTFLANRAAYYLGGEKRLDLGKDQDTCQMHGPGNSAIFWRQGYGSRSYPMH